MPDPKIRSMEKAGRSNFFCIKGVNDDVSRQGTVKLNSPRKAVEKQIVAKSDRRGGPFACGPAGFAADSIGRQAGWKPAVRVRARQNPGARIKKGAEPAVPRPSGDCSHDRTFRPSRRSQTLSSRSALRSRPRQSRTRSRRRCGSLWSAPKERGLRDDFRRLEEDGRGDRCEDEGRGEEGQKAGHWGQLRVQVHRVFAMKRP